MKPQKNKSVVTPQNEVYDYANDSDIYEQEYESDLQEPNISPREIVKIEDHLF